MSETSRDPMNPAASPRDSQPGPQSEPQPRISDARLRLVMILVTGSMFMEILDGTIIATALPSMAKAFGTTAVALNIGVSAYLLALGVFIPASGWVTDRFGARRVFAASVGLFTLSSVLCAQAGELWIFVSLRVLQGMAGAMMVPVGRLVVMRFTPRNQLVVALNNLVWPALVAPVLGPPLGGFITQHFGWRWIFYINLPLGVTALFAAWVLIPQAYGEARRFDWPGFFLSGLGTFALLLGLELAGEGGNAMGLGAMAIGLVLLALAIAHMNRVAAPMIRLKSWGIATFRASIRGGSLARLGIAAVPFLLPLMFQVGFGYTPFHAGLLVLALFAGNITMKLVTTRTLRTFGYRRVLLVNGLACVVTIGACALLTPDTPLVVICAILFASGMARSMQFTTMATLAFADVPKSDMSDANSLFNTTSQLAMAAGIAISALLVRGAEPLAAMLGLNEPGIAYRLAFLGMALLTLTGIIDGLLLPKNAGDELLSRKAA